MAEYHRGQCPHTTTYFIVLSESQTQIAMLVLILICNIFFIVIIRPIHALLLSTGILLQLQGLGLDMCPDRNIFGGSV